MTYLEKLEQAKDKTYAQWDKEYAANGHGGYERTLSKKAYAAYDEYQTAKEEK